MPGHKLVVLSNPISEESDAELNRWYNEQHLPDVLAVPGIVSAQRFKMACNTSGPLYRYLAIYEIEADDPEVVIRHLRSLANTPAMPRTEALDRSTVMSTTYTPMIPQMSSDQAEAIRSAR